MALLFAFATMLPFASKTLDGLQNLTESSGSRQQSTWDGLMTDYTVAFADPYVSTLLAGLFGIGIVLVCSFLLGTSLTRRNKDEQNRIPHLSIKNSEEFHD